VAVFVRAQPQVGLPPPFNIRGRPPMG
jgi:hypothetical protein